MRILLHDYYELEERASKQLRLWKAWHIILYSCAAVFGILNYTFLHSTMSLVDDNCVLYPRNMEFKMVPLPNVTVYKNDDKSNVNYTETGSYTACNDEAVSNFTTNKLNVSDPASQLDGTGDNSHLLVKELCNSTKDILSPTSDVVTQTIFNNDTIIVQNRTKWVLDKSSTLFGKSNTCQFALYMPVMSTVVAIVWLVMFTMCPKGGKPISGLQQPWKILVPALIFAALLVILTGVSFRSTDGGLHQFCADFYNVTGSIKCSAADSLIPHTNSSWRLSGVVSATRACSGGLWASWACVAALLLARCCAAPDFALKRVSAIVSDPHQRLTPYLRTPSSRSSAQRTTIIVSEPTRTELVTGSTLDHDEDSSTGITSLNVTPLKVPKAGDTLLK